MNLHKDPEAFQNAITATAQEFGIREIFIEKDYWVTLILYRLAHSPYVNQAIFKGGTSLSKAYNLIERFSEDIDLAIHAAETMTNNQVKKLIGKIAKEITQDLVEVVNDPVTSKGSRFRKTVHDYGAAESIDYGQARNKILLEINSFASPNPHKLMPISSYIEQFLVKRTSPELIQKFGLQPFKVNVVSLERTFTEKVLALVRTSYQPEPIIELRNKIRHIYDLHASLEIPEISFFLQDSAFFQSIKAVQHDDARNNEFKGEWAGKPLGNCLLFQSPSESWPSLLTTYHGEFRALVHRDLPDQEAILITLDQISSRLKAYDSGNLDSH